MGQGKPGEEGPIGNMGTMGPMGLPGPPGDAGQQGNIGNALSVMNYDQIMSILLKDDTSLKNLSNYLLQNQTNNFLTDISNKISTENEYLNLFNNNIINNNHLVDNIAAELQTNPVYISQLQGLQGDSVTPDLNTLGNVIVNNSDYVNKLSNSILNTGTSFTDAITKNIITSSVKAQIGTFVNNNIYFANSVKAELNNSPVLNNAIRGNVGTPLILNNNIGYQILAENFSPYTIWCGDSTSGACVTPKNVNKITIRGNGQSFIQNTDNNLIINTDDNMYLDSNVNTANKININSNGSNPLIIKKNNGLQFKNWDVNYMNGDNASNKLSFWNNGKMAAQISDNGYVYLRGGINIGDGSGGDKPWGFFSGDENKAQIFYDGSAKVTFNKRGDLSLPNIYMKDRDRKFKLGTWYIENPSYDNKNQLRIGNDNDNWGLVALFNAFSDERLNIYRHDGHARLAFNLGSQDWKVWGWCTNRDYAYGDHANDCGDDSWTDNEHRWFHYDGGGFGCTMSTYTGVCKRNKDGMYRKSS